MALQPFPDVLKDPRFQELPLAEKHRVTEDYWNEVAKADPGKTEFAKGQMQGSKDLIKVREDKATADPLTSRVLGYQEDALSTRLTLADAENNKAFRNTAERDRVMKMESDRLESRRREVEDLVKTHEVNIGEGKKRESVVGFIGGGGAKALAGFSEGAYQSGKDLLNGWNDLSDGVSQVLLESGGDIDKAIGLTREKRASDTKALQQAKESAAASGPGGTGAMAGLSFAESSSQSKFGEPAVVRLEELKTSLDAAGVPEADRPKIIKDAAMATAWTAETADRTRKLSNGELAINPGSVFGDKEGLLAEIKKSDATPGNKELAAIKVDLMRDEMAKTIFSDTAAVDPAFKAFAEKRESEGVTDRPTVLDEWSKKQKDRNWLFQKAPDAVWQGIKTGELGVAKTVVGTAAGIASLWGGGQGLAETQQGLAGTTESLDSASKLRGLNESGLGVTRDLSNTITQMAPMFAGAGLAGGSKTLAAAVTRGASVYGWAAAQGYESKLADAVTLEQQKLGRDLSGDEMAEVLGRPDTQLAAFANGAQTALLAKMLGGGVERAALGKAAESMTVRDFLTKGGREALKDSTLRAEIKGMGKTIFEDFADEAIEESLNQVLDKAISIGALGDTLKMGDLLEETFYAGALGGLSGGALGQTRVRKTHTLTEDELKHAANASLIQQATTSVVAPETVTPPTGNARAGEVRRQEIAAAPDTVTPKPSEPVSKPPVVDPVPAEAPAEEVKSSWADVADTRNLIVKEIGNKEPTPQQKADLQAIDSGDKAVIEKQFGITLDRDAPLAEPPQPETPTPQDNGQQKETDAQEVSKTDAPDEKGRQEKLLVETPEPPPVEPVKSKATEAPAVKDTPRTRMLAALGQPRYEGFPDKVKTEKGAFVELKDRRGYIEVSLETPVEARKQGAATAALTELKAQAVKENVPLRLEVTPINDAPMDKKQLTAFYQKNGFKLQKNGHTMIFDPKAKVPAHSKVSTGRAGETPKTRLDLMLDSVERTGKELTIEVTDANRDNLTKIVSVAEARGMDASTDGRFVLIRKSAPAPEAKPEAPAATTKRSVTNKDLVAAQRLADKVTRGQNNQAREAALNAMVDQLAKNPDTDVALLTKIGKQAAGSRGVRLAEREAQAAGNVGTLDTGLAETLEDAAPAPDKVAQRRDEAKRVTEAMQKLTAVERAAIQGRADGKTSEQIAKEVGTTSGTIDNAASRARVKLREILKLPSGPPVGFHENTAPAVTKAEAAKTDQQVLDDITPALAKATGTDPKTVSEKLRPTGKPLTKGQKSAQQIGAFFGRRVIFVNGAKFNGFNLRAHPGVIVISDNASRSEVLVVFHELVHSLAATDPAAYQKLKDVVKADLAAYVAKFKTRANKDAATTNEEFLADFVADRATDPTFWEGLALKDRPLFDKLVDLFKSILKSVTAGRFGTEAFVKNLKQADEAVRDALNTLRLQAGTKLANKSGEKGVKNEQGEQDARFDELTASIPANPTQADLDAWKAANPEAYQELREMREKVLREAGYGTNQHSKADLKTWGDTVAELNRQERIALGNAESSQKALDAGVSGKMREIAQRSVERNLKLAQERKIKAESGLPPKKVFRGDSASIEVYRMTEGGRSLWATDSPDVARSYGDNVTEIILQMQNPMVFDAEGASFRDLSFEGERLDADDLSDIAKERGHDGLIIKNFYDSNTDDGGDIIADHYTVFDPSQIKSAEPLNLDANGKLIPPSMWGDASSNDIRFEESEGRKPRAVQTAATDNIFFNVKPSVTTPVKQVVARSFNWETVPLDEAGIKKATNFLIKLTNPEFIKELQQRAEKAGVPASRSNLVAGAGRGAVVAYISRLAETDYKSAEILLHKLYRLSSDLVTLFESGGANASELGAALAAHRSYEGGGILNLFGAEATGRREFIKSKQPAAVLDGAKAITAADVTGKGAEDLADAITAALDPAEATRIAEAEKTARAAWDAVIGLLRKIRQAQTAAVKFELPEGESFDSLFDRLLSYEGNKDIPLEDIAALFDQIAPSFEAELGLPEKAAVKKARKTTAKATSTKEASTGTTTTANQADIMAKRRIGLVTRATKEDSDEQAKLKDDFKKLMVSGKTMSDFVEAYVQLGGTEEVGADLFHANETLVERQQDRQAETELRQAQAAAERAAKNAEERYEGAIEKAQEFVDKWGDKVEPRRPTDSNDTPAKALNRFVNPKKDPITSEQLAQQLSEFRNKDGQPTFTEEQVGVLVTKAEWAHEAAVESRSDKAATKAAETIAQREIKAKERRAAAIAKAQEFVDRVGDKGKGATRPTSTNNTPSKTISRYINTKKARVPQATFEQQLRDFTNKDGSPTFTEDQVQEISVRAEIARQDRKAADELRAQDRAEAAIAKREVAQLAKAANLTSSPGPKLGSDGRSVRGIILQDYINNPERKIRTQAERIQLAEDILREKLPEISDADRPGIAAMMEAQLALKLEEAKFKAARPLLKHLAGKTLTQDQIEKAIRLEILDPSKDFISSVAALSGWQGLSPRETMELTRLQRESDIAGPGSNIALVNLNKQARIIKGSVGIPPKWVAWVNAYIRAAVFSGTGSFIIGHTVGGYLSMSTYATELVTTLKRGVTRPGEVLNELGVLHDEWWKNYARGKDAWLTAMKTGVSYTDQIMPGGEENPTDRKVFIDALTQSFLNHRNALQRAAEALEAETDPLKRTGIRAKQLGHAFIAYVANAPRFTFNMVTAPDAGFAKQVAASQNAIMQYRAARDAGITAAEFDQISREAQRVAESHAEYLQNELGLTEGGLQLRIETRDAFEGAVTNALMNRGVDVAAILESTTLDVQSKMGTVATSKSFIGRMTDKTVGFLHATESANILPLAGFGLTIRTSFNVLDEYTWLLPGANLPRIFNLNPKNGKLFSLKTLEQTQETFPNIKQQWQLDRRRIQAAIGYTIFPVIYALLAANDNRDDDEKWFWFTGQAPVYGSPESLKWERNGWTENTLMFGRNSLKLDRGFAQTLLPLMIGAKTLHDSVKAGFSKEELASQLNYLSETFVPGVSHVLQLSKDYNRMIPGGGKAGVLGLVEKQGSLLVPSALKTVRKFQPRVDARQSEAPKSELNPLYVNTDNPGVVQVTNVLGEPLAMDSNPWGWVERIGVPFFRRVEGKRDPRKVEIFQDFDANGYSGGEYSVKQFKERIAGTDTEFSYDLYQRWNKVQIEQFVERYDIAPDEEDYANKVGAVWSRARERADRELGIRRKN